MRGMIEEMQWAGEEMETSFKPKKENVRQQLHLELDNSFRRDRFA